MPNKCDWRLTWSNPGNGYSVNIEGLTMDVNSTSDPTHLVAQGTKPTGRTRGCQCKAQTDSRLAGQPKNNNFICGPVKLLPPIVPKMDLYACVVHFLIAYALNMLASIQFVVKGELRCNISVEEKVSAPCPGRRVSPICRLRQYCVLTSGVSC